MTIIIIIVSMNNTVINYSLTETAKLIREALKGAFPNTKFSVKSKSYSGGCSISVRWTDGPVGSDVKRITDRFEGASFDGMQDLKSYNEPSEWKGQRVSFHVDYIFPSRSESEGLLREAADWVSYHTGLPALEIADGYFKGGNELVPFQLFTRDNGEQAIAHDSHRGEWYSNIVAQYSRTISREQLAKPATLPEYVTDSYINSTVEALLGGAA